MAKVSFLKLALPKTSTLATTNINGQEIEVKKYIPIDFYLENLMYLMQRKYLKTGAMMKK